MADPLEEQYQAPLPSLAPIPWNKLALSVEGRQAVAKALLDGYPRNQIAKALGTTVKTLKRLIDEDGELLDAVDVRKDAEEAELRELLMGMARKGDTVAAIFLGKSQFGWRDRDDGRVKFDTDGQAGVLVVPGTIPLDQWSVAALKQQEQYREAPQDVLDQMAESEAEARKANAPHTGTPGIEGLRLVKPGR
ncbi:hypothetical protein AMC99_01830 [Altererythrobacter epoxidivorans]|uniref:Uncharacterized protein n=1 Tax=Altererythrobacter epoxidivorans TaxID=361183 RepID=A0A0M4MHP9_9SPHN|nr:hypothetical protein [Altererythrobacter epoxidivorans]ALE17118.1 hypothetical protein AMC99_01830 [Altererythrobacter epoxidivorans]